MLENTRKIYQYTKHSKLGKWAEFFSASKRPRGGVAPLGGQIHQHGAHRYSSEDEADGLVRVKEKLRRISPSRRRKRRSAGSRAALPEVLACSSPAVHARERLAASPNLRFFCKTMTTITPILLSACHKNKGQRLMHTRHPTEATANTDRR